jgi:uncharacterized protein (TIGR01777 family)
MRIAVTGSTGLIGKALLSHLHDNGHETVALVRRAPQSASEVQWDPTRGTLNAKDLEGVQGVVHLAGAGIGDKRWTDSYKKEILESRTKSTALLAARLTELGQQPTVFLSGSAIGIYGPRDSEVLGEDASHGNTFLASVCEEWESAASPAVTAGIRTAFLRTGIVLSPKGGALKKQLPLFKIGAGGKFGNGKQWQSWISITDEVRAITHLLTSTLAGPVNLTAPTPVTNAEFTKTLAQCCASRHSWQFPPLGQSSCSGRNLPMRCSSLVNASFPMHYLPMAFVFLTAHWKKLCATCCSRNLHS